MADNLEIITSYLRQLQESNKAGPFVVFLGDEEQNYYVQLCTLSELEENEVRIAREPSLGEPPDPNLQGETVGDEFLATPLTDEQDTQLAGLGWVRPDEYNSNYSRYWKASTDAERQEIARVVLQMFAVYGVAADVELSINADL